MKIIINEQVFNLNEANTFFKRFMGLMWKKNIQTGLFFPRTNSIHTFFMKDQIDIIMINKKNEVVFYQKNLGKNKVIIKRKAYHTIELPKGSLKNINLGNHIIIKKN